jgi:hypothetical protein
MSLGLRFDRRSIVGACNKTNTNINIDRFFCNLLIYYYFLKKDECFTAVFIS